MQNIIIQRNGYVIVIVTWRDIIPKMIGCACNMFVADGTLKIEIEVCKCECTSGLRNSEKIFKSAKCDLWVTDPREARSTGERITQDTEI